MNTRPPILRLLSNIVTLQILENKYIWIFQYCHSAGWTTKFPSPMTSLWKKMYSHKYPICSSHTSIIESPMSSLKQKQCRSETSHTSANNHKMFFSTFPFCCWSLSWGKLKMTNYVGMSKDHGPLFWHVLMHLIVYLFVLKMCSVFVAIRLLQSDCCSCSCAVEHLEKKLRRLKYSHHVLGDVVACIWDWGIGIKLYLGLRNWD